MIGERCGGRVVQSPASLDRYFVLSSASAKSPDTEAAMARTPQDVTDAELAVLQALWDAGPTAIRQLAETLYGDASAAKYATVQKLLERLERDGFVTRDRAAAAHTFTAAVGRDELIGRRLRDV